MARNVFGLPDPAAAPGADVAETPAPAPRPNVFAVAENEDARKDEFLSQVFGALKENPEDRAAIKELATRTRAPIDQVERAFPEFKAAAEKLAFDPRRFRREYPDLAKLALEQPDVGEIALKDPGLPWLVKAVKRAFGGWVAPASLGEEGMAAWKEGGAAAHDALIAGDKAAGPKAEEKPQPVPMVVDPSADFSWWEKLVGRAQPKPGAPAPAGPGWGPYSPQALQQAEDAAKGRSPASAPTGPTQGARAEPPLPPFVTEPRIPGVLASAYRQGELGMQISELGREWALKVVRGEDTWDVEKRIVDLKRQMVPRFYGDDLWSKTLDATGQFLPQQVQMYVSSAPAAGAAYAAASLHPATRPLAGKAARAAGVGTAWFTTFGAEFGNQVLQYGDLKTDAGEPLSPEARVGWGILYGAVSATVEIANEMGPVLGQLGPLGAAFRRGEMKAVAEELLKRDPRFRAILTDVAKAWAKGAAGEGGEEFVQNIAGDAIGYLARVVQAKGKLQSADVVGSLVEAAQAGEQGALGSVLPGAGHSTVHLVTRLAGRQAARAGGEALSAVIDQSKGVTARYAPDAYAQIARDLTERYGQKVDAFYFDTPEVLRLFQDENLTAAGILTEEAEAASRELMGETGPERLRAALATGSKLEVPVAEFAERWAPAPIADALKEHVSAKPWQATIAEEAKSAAAREEEVAAVLKAIDQGESTPTPEEAALDRLAQDLAAAGKMKPAEVRDQVKLWRKHLNAMSIRAEVPLAALVEQFQVRVRDANGVPVEPAPASAALTARYAGMGPEEKLRTFFVDRNTGALNARAFERLPADPARPMVAHVSIEGTKWANDSGDHLVGNRLYRMAARALHAVAPDVAKVGGDFVVRVKDQGELDALLAAAQAKMDVSGFAFTGVAATSLDEARAGNAALKQRLEGEGARAPRGARPLGVPEAVASARDVAFPEAAIEQVAVPGDLVSAFGRMGDEEAFNAAFTDAATGLLSEDGFFSSPARKHVVAVDLKGLKLINATFGETFGDEMLRQFGLVMTLAGGADFDAARLHGDEYALQGDDVAALEGYLDKLARMSEDVGVEFKYGIGADYAAADRDLSENKRQRPRREEAGAGAAGDRRPGDLREGRAADPRGVRRQGWAGSSQGGGPRVDAAPLVWAAIRDSAKATIAALKQAHGDTAKNTPEFWRAEEQLARAGTALDRLEQRARRAAAGEANLLVQHNLTAENLVHADALGGLAAPSLAVSRKEHPLTGFGEITLIARPERIDPATGVPVFGADVYSPRWPETRWKLNTKKVWAFAKEARPFAEATRLYLGDIEGELSKDGPEKTLERKQWQAGLGMMFLKERGLPVEPVMREVEAPSQRPWSVSPALLKFKEEHPEIDFEYSDELRLDEPRREMGEAVKAAIAEYAEKLVKADVWDAEDAADFVKRTVEREFEDDGKTLSINSAVTIGRALKKAGTREVDTDATQEEVLHRLNSDPKVRAEFDAWARERTAPLFGAEHIAKWRDTANGPERRLIPYTLENVLKELTRKVRAGEDFNYGLGTARSMGAKKFRSIADIQKAREKIISKEQFDVLKKQMDERFGELAEAVRQYHADPTGFRVLDALASAIGQSYVRGRYLSQELKSDGFSNVPADLVQKIGDFAADLLAMPTEYFEAKPQRAVGIGEFEAAVIPDSAPAAVRAVLKKHGVQVIEYPKGDEAARAQAIAGAAETAGVLFQPAFHGTPTREIDRFLLSKIGTGEGAQVYGWGLYFAQNKDVAEEYRRNLSRRHGVVARSSWEFLPAGEEDGAEFYQRLSTEERAAWSELHARASVWRGTYKDAGARVLADLRSTVADGAKQEAYWNERLAEYERELKAMGEAPALGFEYDPDQSYSREQLEKLEARANFMDDWQHYQAGVKNAHEGIDKGRRRVAEAKAALDLVEKYGLVAKPPQEPGQAYKVDVPENDVLLDYDAPFGLQPAKVQEAIRKLFGDLRREWTGKIKDAAREHDAARAELKAFHDTWKDPYRAGRVEGVLAVVDAQGKPIHGERYDTEAAARSAANDDNDFQKQRALDPILAKLNATQTRWSSLHDAADRLDLSSVDATGATMAPEKNAQLTGAALYGRLSAAFEEVSGVGGEAGEKAAAKEASLALQGVGIPGLRYRDQGSRAIKFFTRDMGDGTFGVEDADGLLVASGFPTRGAAHTEAMQRTDAVATRNFVVWDEESLKIVDRLYAGENDPGGARGWTAAVRRGAKHLFDIILTKKADRSTFLHESGHVFMDILAELAARPNANAQLRADWEATLRFVGAKDRAELADRRARAAALRAAAVREGRELTAAEKREVAALVEPFEKWARGFETYLLEGKAPSLDLAGAFERFRLWLTSIYRSASALGVPLNEEIRGVFDRLIATDEEIARARAEVAPQTMFRSPEEAGMTPEQWQAHLKKQEKAVSRSSLAARQRALRERLRVADSWWERERAARVAEALEEHDAMPASVALRFLRTGDPGDNAALAVLLDAARGRRAAEEKGKAPLPHEVQRRLDELDAAIANLEFDRRIGIEAAKEGGDAAALERARTKVAKDVDPLRLRSVVRTVYVEVEPGRVDLAQARSEPDTIVGPLSATELAEGRQARALKLPSWLSLEDYLGDRTTWDWTWSAFGTQEAPEAAQRLVADYVRRAFEAFPDTDRDLLLRGYALAGLATKARGEFMQSMRDKLSEWIRTPEASRRFEDPFSDRMWRYIVGRYGAKFARWAADTTVTAPRAKGWLGAVGVDPANLPGDPAAPSVSEVDARIAALRKEREKVAADAERSRVAATRARAKLDYASAVQAVDPEVVKKKLKGLTATDGGVTADDLAELVQAESGAALVQGIVDLPPRREWAEARAGERMKADYPDVLTEREELRKIASEEFHGDEMLAWLLDEWDLIRKRLNATADAELRAAMPVEAVRRAAQQFVERQGLARLDAGHYERAEQSSAEKAFKAAAKRDYQQAFVLWQQRILNHLIFRELVEARKDRDRLEEAAKYLAKGKTRASLGKASQVLRSGAEQILVALGFSEPFQEAQPPDRQPATMTEVVDAIEGTGTTVLFDSEALSALMAQPPARPVTAGRPGEVWQGLTVGQARNVLAALVNIRAAGTAGNTILLEGKRVEWSELKPLLIAEAERNLPDRGPPTSSVDAGSLLGTAGGMVSGLDGELLRMTSLMRDFLGRDAGIDSWWYRTVVLPLQQAKHREADLLTKAIQPVIDAMERIPAAVKKRMRDRIDGEKLFPTHTDVVQAPTRRYELISMALNAGNEGNLERLLIARGITYEELMGALSLLTREELEYVQTVWDAAEGLWPYSRDLEERLAGMAPPKIDPRPITIRLQDGTEVALRGGYFPAVYDRRVDVKGEIQADEVRKGMDFLDPGFTRPGTAHSHTKGRVEGTKGIISLDPTVIQAHLLQVAHDIAFREAVLSVGSIFLDKDIQATLRRRVGEKKALLPIDWVKDIGRARAAEATSQARMWNRVNRGLRSNMAVGVLGYAADVALGDITNIGVAAGVFEDPRHLAAGVAEAVRDPMKARAWALEKSGELRFRADETLNTWRRHRNELTKRRFPGREALDFYVDHAFTFFETTDALTATPVWIGAYREGLAKFEGDDAKAVIYADDLLARVFPSHSPVDMAAIQRDRGFWGSAMLFFGYLNTIYGLRRALGHEAWSVLRSEEATTGDRAAAVAQLGWRMIAIVACYQVLGEWLTGRGREPDDRLWEWVLRKALMGLTVNDLPFGSLAEPVVTKAVTGQARRVSARAAPAVAVVEDAGRSVMQAFDGNADGMEAFLDLSRSLGLVAGAPIRPLRTLKYGAELAGGRTQARGPGDVVSGAIYGERDNQPGNPARDLQNLFSEGINP